LDGYAYLISQIRKHTDNGISRDEAIKRAVNHCIDKGILSDFLKENFEEVCDMLAWECTYDEELEIREEEGVFKSAILLIKSGMGFEDVATRLKLSDWQIQELKERMT